MPEERSFTIAELKDGIVLTGGHGTVLVVSDVIAPVRARPAQAAGETVHVHLVLVGAEGCGYKLDVEGSVYEGTIGTDGVLERVVPKSRKPATLTVAGDGGDQVYQLAFGDMPPITQAAGVQARLNALGYSAGSSGAIDEQTAAAIAEFQEHSGLDPATGLNDETRDLLERAYTSR